MEEETRFILWKFLLVDEILEKLSSFDQLYHDEDFTRSCKHILKVVEIERREGV